MAASLSKLLGLADCHNFVQALRNLLEELPSSLGICVDSSEEAPQTWPYHTRFCLEILNQAASFMLSHCFGPEAASRHRSSTAKAGPNPNRKSNRTRVCSILQQGFTAERRIIYRLVPSVKNHFTSTGKAHAFCNPGKFRTSSCVALGCAANTGPRLQCCCRGPRAALARATSAARAE